MNGETKYFYIAVTTDFEATHRYPLAPEGVDFLRYPHRHIFRVRAQIRVTHDDRELEFILVKRFLTKRIREVWDGKDLGQFSCEMMCDQIYSWLVEKYGQREMTIEVSEDGENTGILHVP
jgi:hypothetical protein